MSHCLWWAESSSTIPHDHQDICRYGSLGVPQLPHGHAVSWLTQSWPVTAILVESIILFGQLWICIVWSYVWQLDGRRGGFCVWAVQLDAQSVLPCSEQCYWMHEVYCYHGPHIGCQFLLWVLFPFFTETYSCTGPMELKTLTLLMMLGIIIYLILWL